VLDTACERDPADGRTTVESVADPADWDDAWGPNGQVVGFTIHTWQQDTLPNLVDADIVLNTSAFEFDAMGLRDDAFDTRAVVAHEMGHVLGI